jgi:hypothetical protein
MKRYLISFLIIFQFLQAAPLEKPKKYNLSVCALFKNEDKYLKEWIEYHQLIGVDHFYLYDNRSTDSFRRILSPYIRKGIVSLIQWQGADKDSPVYQEKSFIWPLSTQISAYENAIKYLAPKETKWLVILDINEFLVPTYAKTLTELLDRYDAYPGVLIPNDCFDSSKDTLPKRKLIIETTELTKAPDAPIEREVTKMVFKPNLCTSFTWPPYKCDFKNDQQPVAIKASDFENIDAIQKPEIRINRYVNRGDYHHGKIKPRIHVDNRYLSSKEIAEILNENYEIEDQERPIYRYIPQLKKNLGMHE